MVIGLYNNHSAAGLVLMRLSQSQFRKSEDMGCGFLPEHKMEYTPPAFGADPDISGHYSHLRIGRNSTTLEKAF